MNTKILGCPPLAAKAYGWPTDLTDGQILDSLVALNSERAQEEERGVIRWLRPEYQIPRFAKYANVAAQELDLGEIVTTADKTLPAFPTDRYEQPLAIEATLLATQRAMDAAELSRCFKRGGKRIEPRIAQILTTLVRYGRVLAQNDRYIARRAA